MSVPLRTAPLSHKGPSSPPLTVRSPLSGSTKYSVTSPRGVHTTISSIHMYIAGMLTPPPRACTHQECTHTPPPPIFSLSTSSPSLFPLSFYLPLALLPPWTPLGVSPFLHLPFAHVPLSSLPSPYRAPPPPSLPPPTLPSLPSRLKSMTTAKMSGYARLVPSYVYSITNACSFTWPASRTLRRWGQDDDRASLIPGSATRRP